MWQELALLTFKAPNCKNYPTGIKEFYLAYYINHKTNSAGMNLSSVK